MFTKVYISLDGYHKDEIDEIHNYSFLKQATEEEIFSYFYSKSNMYEENEYVMGMTTSLEYYLFYSLLRQKGYTTEQIITLESPSLCILNDELFLLQENNIVSLYTDNVGFFSIRGIDWQHPFFFLLKKLLEKTGGIAKRNNDFSYMSSRGKFYALSNLYEKRKELIGDICIPYNIKNSQIETFKNFLEEKFGEHILVKKDFYSCGEGNIPVDFNEYNDFQKEKFIQVLRDTDTKLGAVYIVPIENFEEEYRVYFTKNKGLLQIYSIKKKNVNIHRNEIMNMSVFKYGGYFDWSYILYEDTKAFGDITNQARIYLEHLEYDCGNIEFGKTKEGEFKFFEVNTMGSAMPYKGSDTKKMIEYYQNIFSDMCDK